MTYRNLTTALAAVLLVVAASLGYVSVKKVQRQAAVADLCDFASNSQWDEALEIGDSVTGPDAEGRIAAECLCWAYAASERLEDCSKLVDRILAHPDGHDWVPDITLTRLVVRERRDTGRYEEAADLARRANGVYAHDPHLLEAEMINRSVVEDELSVIEDMKTRLTDDFDESIALRLVLSAGYERRGDYEASLDVLGETPPPTQTPIQEAWFESRTTAFAGLQRIEDLKQTYRDWEALGGDPIEMRARYALRASMFGLSDPQHSRTRLLELAFEDEADIPAKGIRKTLYERLIGHYLVDGRVDEALEVFDKAAEVFDNVLMSRDEIVRSAKGGRLADLGSGHEPNQLVFRAPADGPSGTLLVSPPPGSPADTEFESFVLRAGSEVRVPRKADIHPQRWVFRDEQDRAVASGNTWSDTAESIIDIKPGTPLARASYTPNLKPGDGRRRVFVIIPDCADWRILQYMSARGELPVHQYLHDNGYSAVLWSTPAFTGAAMESLVWPTRGKHVTFIGLANRLGIELGGLASVGKNPFDFLKHVLPEGENLFERVGAGPYTSANLLFSHGYIDAGNHAELIGPHGQRRPAKDLLAFRPMAPDEAEMMPDVIRHHRGYRGEAEKMAGELDSAVNLAKAGDVDLLLIRIEPVDILTHTFYTEMLRSKQSDGQETLLWAYRYLDQRLAEIWEALDSDDVFIVMSDHGIRTALEHDEASVFMAVGPGVPKGRAKGTPHLRGFPRLIADLFDLETDWPDTQIAEWARQSWTADAKEATKPGS